MIAHAPAAKPKQRGNQCSGLCSSSLATPTGKRLAEIHKQSRSAVFGEVGQIIQGKGREMLVDIASDKVLGNAWKNQLKAADANNVPGRFTALRLRPLRFIYRVTFVATCPM